MPFVTRPGSKKAVLDFAKVEGGLSVFSYKADIFILLNDLN